MIPLCAGGPILVCGGSVTLLMAAILGLVKNSGAYTEAMAAARGDTAVVAALGTPIDEGFFVAGNVEINGQSGYAQMTIPISGPRGSGTLYVEAEKAGPEWYFHTLELAVDGTGEWIDLLE